MEEIIVMKMSKFFPTDSNDSHPWLPWYFTKIEKLGRLRKYYFLWYLQ